MTAEDAGAGEAGAGEAGAEAVPRRLLGKPRWVVEAEARVASAVPVHPNLLSALKLAVVTPGMVLALRQVDVLPGGATLVTALFGAFFVLDYLDGVVARGRGLESTFGRFLDRATDYPLLLVVSWFAADVVPMPLLIAKLAVDLLLLVLYLLGMGSTENRLRTAISYTTVLALLFLGQGWAPRLVNELVVEVLLWTSLVFSSVVALYNLKILQKRFIADALSGANLLCGGMSMYFASLHAYEISLVFLILGAGFDGFDGAAARRWGGTRFGVYSDDIADGVNYGIAPGVALYFALDGVVGIAAGTLYATFTISRLVFFTLAKDGSDPNFFRGVPSTVGGVVTLCSIIVFENSPSLIGLMVGIACAQMVSFSTYYRHLGRALAKRRRALFGAPVYVLALLLGARIWGPKAAAAVVLAGALAYGMWPTVLAFADVIRKRRSDPDPPV